MVTGDNTLVQGHGFWFIHVLFSTDSINVLRKYVCNRQIIHPHSCVYFVVFCHLFMVIYAMPPGLKLNKWAVITSASGSA